VANHTRDALIAARGKDSTGESASYPVMIIDKDSIPHGFCIRKSSFLLHYEKLIRHRAQRDHG
jgi:hypothetical protein